MSDHIPDTGKMVPDRVVMLRTIAAILDHPSVYMGGPSQLNMRRAEQILAAVAPLIAAAERERVAKWHDEQADGERSLAQAARSAGDREAGGHHAHLAAEHRQSAAAIRAMGNADE